VKRACVVARQASEHQSGWGTAFARGLRKHGWEVDIRENSAPADLVVFWGVRRQDEIRAQKARGGRVCILERGYVGDRFKWTSVSFGGGLNGRGQFRGPLDDPSRWEKHFSKLMKPWRGIRGGPVLILGQVPTDMSVRGVDLNGFYQEAARAFRAKKFEVRFRPHPKAPDERPQGIEIWPAGQDLAKAFNEVACAVTWNSNSGVDAVLAGVPTVAMDQGSMAWGVTGHELAMPPQPERAAWAHSLAWKQFTAEEMASGECWEAVGCPS
jgi:hypothetical protein